MIVCQGDLPPTMCYLHELTTSVTLGPSTNSWISGNHVLHWDQGVPDRMHEHPGKGLTMYLNHQLDLRLCCINQAVELPTLSGYEPFDASRCATTYLPLSLRRFFFAQLSLSPLALSHAQLLSSTIKPFTFSRCATIYHKTSRLLQLPTNQSRNNRAFSTIQLLCYHALLPCSATMLCYHNLLPRSATMLHYYTPSRSAIMPSRYYAL